MLMRQGDGKRTENKPEWQGEQVFAHRCQRHLHRAARGEGPAAAHRHCTELALDTAMTAVQRERGADVEKTLLPKDQTRGPHNPRSTWEEGAPVL